MIINYFRWVFFQSKVQAELLAQCGSQQFVNLICHRPKALEELEAIRHHAYFRKEKCAPFLAVCRVLYTGMEDESLEFEVKQACATLLSDRFAKAAADRQFCLKHWIIFSEIQDKLEEWEAAYPADVAA